MEKVKIHELWGFDRLIMSAVFNPKKGILYGQDGIQYLAETVDGDTLVRKKTKTYNLFGWTISKTSSEYYQADSTSQNKKLLESYGAKETVVNKDKAADIFKNQAIIVTIHQQGNAGTDAIGHYALSTQTELELFCKQYYKTSSEIKGYIIDKKVLDDHGIYHKNAYIIL